MTLHRSSSEDMASGRRKKVDSSGFATEKDLPVYNSETLDAHDGLAFGIRDDTHRKLKARHIQLIGIVPRASRLLAKYVLNTPFQVLAALSGQHSMFRSVAVYLMAVQEACLLLSLSGTIKVIADTRICISHFSSRCSVVLAVTTCMAEMVTYLPISSPFIRFAGRYVDEAFGFAAGMENFFN